MPPILLAYLTRRVSPRLELPRLTLIDLREVIVASAEEVGGAENLFARNACIGLLLFLLFTENMVDAYVRSMVVEHQIVVHDSVVGEVGSEEVLQSPRPSVLRCFDIDDLDGV